MRSEFMVGAVIGVCLGMWVLVAGCEVGTDEQVKVDAEAEAAAIAAAEFEAKFRLVPAPEKYRKAIAWANDYEKHVPVRGGEFKWSVEKVVEEYTKAAEAFGFEKVSEGRWVAKEAPYYRSVSKWKVEKTTRRLRHPVEVVIDAKSISNVRRNMRPDGNIMYRYPDKLPVIYGSIRISQQQMRRFST